MVPLNGDQRLLHAAVSYTLAGTALAAPPMLSRPTPCVGWNLHTLLDHVSDSIGALREAMTMGTIALDPAGDRDVLPPFGRPAAGRSGQASPDPVARLRRQAASLLDTCLAASPADRLVAVGDRVLTGRLVTVTGSLEIAVHGWDIYTACGIIRPVPPRLASVLLPIAPLLVPLDARDDLFWPPVQLPPLACPGDQLVAFLGRHPRPLGPPASPATTHPATP